MATITCERAPNREIDGPWSVVGQGAALALPPQIARQLVTTAIDRALRPLELTFARYEVLMLLNFSKTGALPTTKVGERLLVHPTGITRLVDKLEDQELVSRQVHPEDRRSTLVQIEPAGRRLAQRATDILVDLKFGVSLDHTELQTLIDLLGTFRADFNST